MAITNAANGQITSSASTWLQHVLSTGQDVGFTWNQTTDTEDTTPFGSSTAVSRSFTPTARSGTVAWRAWYDDNSIKGGRRVTLAAASGSDTPYTTSINQATLSLTVNLEDTTSFGVTANVAGARTYTPASYTGTLTYSGFLDTGSAFPQTEAPEVATFNTFTLTAEQGTNDATVSFGGIVTAYTVGEVTPGVVTPVSATVQISGDLTCSTNADNSNDLLPASGASSGPLLLPVAGETVLQTDTGKTFTMDTVTSSLTIDFPVSGLIAYSGTEQISDTVTVA